MKENYGPCCVCEGNKDVRNIVMLSKQSPHGHGWGCIVCGLSSTGAAAIICDTCATKDGITDRLRFYCIPISDDDYMSGRAPISELDHQPTHEHNMEFHADEN